MAASDQEIEPAGVGHIEKAGAPADVGITGAADAGGPAYVLEAVCAHVAPEGFGLFLESGDEEAEAAGVVVIGEVDAHVAELRAVAAEGNSGEHADFGKSAVAI